MKKKISLLEEVSSGESAQELSQRLKLPVAFIERLQKLARRVIRKGVI